MRQAAAVSVARDGIASLFLGLLLFRSSRGQSSAPADASPSPSDPNHALEKAASIRKRFGIKVTHPHDTPCPLTSFQELEDENPELKGIHRFAESKAYHQPTPIQMQAIPPLIEKRDVIGIAPTGSGKTLAFLVPLLSQLRRNKDASGLKALIISPTCELSAQTYKTFLSLQEALTGNHDRIRALLLDARAKQKIKDRIFDVLFATPMASVKLIDKKSIDTRSLEFLVLDEADRLFSTEKTSKEVDLAEKRHYVAQLDLILASCCRGKVVKGLFSATLPPHVSDLARNVLNDPVAITVGKKNGVVRSVEQKLVYTGNEQGKLLAMRQIFAKGVSPPVLVFVDTKQRAKELLMELRKEGRNVAGMHSEMETKTRNAILRKFQNEEIWILIATDLVSRGIDFLGVNMVINYDFPKSTTDYIHRIGRTGRAGHTGMSYTFFTDGDRGHLRPIANTIREAGGDVPHWMTSLKKEDWKQKVASNQYD